MADGADISVNVSTLPLGVKRLDELKKYFVDEYGLEPEYYVKVPGRYKQVFSLNYFCFGWCMW